MRLFVAPILLYPVGPLPELVDALRGKLDFTDGLKVVGRNYWLHIRPSQTEHLVRVIGESRDRAVIETQISKVKRILYG